jgi:hypothetical protein
MDHGQAASQKRCFVKWSSPGDQSDEKRDRAGAVQLRCEGAIDEDRFNRD